MILRDDFPGRDDNESSIKPTSHLGRRLARGVLVMTAATILSPSSTRAQQITADKLVLSTVPAEVKQQAANNLNSTPFESVVNDFDQYGLKLRIKVRNPQQLTEPNSVDTSYMVTETPKVGFDIKVSLKDKLISTQAQEKAIRKRQSPKDRKKSLFLISCNDGNGTIYNRPLNGVNRNTKRKTKVEHLDIPFLSIPTIDEAAMPLDPQSSRIGYRVGMTSLSLTCGVYPRVMSKKAPNRPAMSWRFGSNYSANKKTLVEYANPTPQ